MKPLLPAIVLLLLLAVLHAGPAHAGPAEARARWREAGAMSKNAPWRDRLVAYRAVRLEAPSQDPINVRAIAAEAKILRDAGHAHGGAASEAAAACFGGRRDPDRLAAALSAARELIADNDPAGARPLLDDVLENGGIATPQLTGPVLRILAREAYDAQDLASLSKLDRRAANDIPTSLAIRLEILDLLGLLRLEAGEVAAAKRVLSEQRRIYDEARRAGGAPEREAAKAWLDLDLPKRL